MKFDGRQIKTGKHAAPDKLRWDVRVGSSLLFRTDAPPWRFRLVCESR